MELYVGMDVSLREMSICVVDGDGEIVFEGTVVLEPLPRREQCTPQVQQAELDIQLPS